MSEDGEWLTSDYPTLLLVRVKGATRRDAEDALLRVYAALSAAGIEVCPDMRAKIDGHKPAVMLEVW